MKDEMINYIELTKIMWDKYKATDDELRYWIKLAHPDKIPHLHSLASYHVDLPLHKESTICPLSNPEFHRPRYRFYKLEYVKKFVPDPCLRFVYFRDLTARENWFRDNLDDELRKANEVGILRFYDKTIDEFTLHKTLVPNPMMPDKPSKELWAYSADINDFIGNPETFFLLYDIITIERVFHGRNRQSCFEELYGKEGHPKE